MRRPWSLAVLLATILVGVKEAGKGAAIGGGQSGPRVTPWPEPYLNYDYLRKAWETSGREWMSTYSGVKWNPSTRKWEIDTQWPDQANDVAQDALYLEYSARGVVNMGLLCHDVRLLNELAEFYTAYAQRFTTLGAMRRRKSASMNADLLNNQGDDSTRTLLWIEKEDHGSSIRECLLCNSQFFHPVSRLIKVITLFPDSERTPSMKNFARLYAPLVVRDHLLRILYQAEWNYYDAEDLPHHLVDIWKAISASSRRPKFSYQYAMQNYDLLLIATAAEILGANAKDPALVPLKPNEKANLKGAVEAGIRLFKKKRTNYSDAENFRGVAVGRASYFNGDFDDHEDMEYSGYNGESIPAEGKRQVHRGASWDISHSYIVPVFLRSLYDNRKATEVAFPSARDLELVTNQYVYKVFRSDFDRPLFNNFLDGSNGWYRVGYHGTAFGYPPVQYCDCRSGERPCLIDGAIQGWGLIASFNSDLMELEHALLKLAWRDDAQTNLFKERYYCYNGQSYSFRNSQGHLQYPTLLFWMLSCVPEKLQGCGSG